MRPNYVICNCKPKHKNKPKNIKANLQSAVKKYKVQLKIRLYPEKKYRLHLLFHFLLLGLLSNNHTHLYAAEPIKEFDAMNVSAPLLTADTKANADIDTAQTKHVPMSTSDGQTLEKSADTVELPTIQVKAKKFRVITPMPGVVIDNKQSTTNIQSASGKELAESKALNVTEFMNGEMQSVSTSDYAGNPFQQDLNYRGFTASPSIGTAQGISVYLDGVRVNEAFGEVVNWDLIPMNALASLDMIPGSNPMFGLNTLGGALALRTKTGFTDNHARGQILAGSWGRKQVQLSNGFNNGTLGLFSALSYFDEEGWRKNSPSNLWQIYNNATLKFRYGEINLSALNVGTHLTGNGLLPVETTAIDRSAVFTSPDESKNSLGHYNLNARFDLSDFASISVLTYRRKVDQSAIGADFFENYKALQNAWGGPDMNGDGINDVGLLNGLFNRSQLNQSSKGSALQLSLDLEKHQFTLGATYDNNNIKFTQSQQLAEIDENHYLSLPTDPVFAEFGYSNETSLPGIIRNNLKGSSTTKSIFFSDTWSPIDTLHITYGARFNWTNVKNTLRSDRGKDLHNFVPRDFTKINDRCRRNSRDFTARWMCTEGDYDYYSFNPALGLAWEPIENLTVYGNISRGARTPSVIELGCAKDHTLDGVQNNSTNMQFGCSIPTALSADPYLKQVRSTSYEMGLRGSHAGFDWNLGAFRTELTDDILFVPLGRKNRGVFDNFGQTLRQGIEMGMKGEIGKSKLGLNYTFMRATYESPAQLINESNSSNTAPTTIQSYINIRPGDELAGMPRHIVQASWNYRFNDRFDTTLSMVTHSSSFVRGNENNDHVARAASHQIGSGADRDPLDYIGSGKVAGYTVLNLKANYKFDHGITLFAKVDNLLNKNYATAGDLGKNGFAASGSFVAEANNWKKTTFIGSGAPLAIWVGLNFDMDWKKLKKQEND